MAAPNGQRRIRTGVKYCKAATKAAMKDLHTSVSRLTHTEKVIFDSNFDEEYVLTPNTITI